jgi:hypothetical protein
VSHALEMNKIDDLPLRARGIRGHTFDFRFKVRGARKRR